MNTLHKAFPLTPQKLESLSPIDLAVFDQFIVRFSKLQEIMGAISSAAQWLKLREMRNQFAHDYPVYS
ncbi:hypothetical protein KQ940_03490 [Marinobacterium sp. D7]|uniref:hypothetical protein n=1 Tax=Marinobacterium ramblicola TaxID=2849041 RepID=UPI001C2DC714|nr:hypothetical protein [Marinobacterium ramblicola]MBV1787109.1 hypothetical protein [Marinobacterium ramblicola]